MTSRYIAPEEEASIYRSMAARDRIDGLVQDRDHWVFVFFDFQLTYLGLIGAVGKAIGETAADVFLETGVVVEPAFDGYESDAILFVMGVPKTKLSRRQLVRILKRFHIQKEDWPPPDGTKDLLCIAAQPEEAQLRAFNDWLRLEQHVFSMN